MKLSKLATVVLILPPVVMAASTTASVPGKAGPWLASLNPAFPYTWTNDYAAPTVVNASSGIPFTAGSKVIVTYLSGIVDGHDANGDLSNVTNYSDGANGRFPGFYMNPGPNVYGGELVGAFANAGVVIGIPFGIGNNPTTLTIPAGATELLLGVNDNYYSDNTGSYTVMVTSVPEPQYSICLFYDQGKAAKSGSTLPIKFQLCNSTGTNVSSSGIIVHATNIVQTSTSASGDVQDSGNANPDGNFRYDSTLGGTGGYIFNVSTKDLNGTYRIYFTVTGDSFNYFVSFQVK